MCTSLLIYLLPTVHTNWCCQQMRPLLLSVPSSRLVLSLRGLYINLLPGLCVCPVPSFPETPITHCGLLITAPCAPLLVHPPTRAGWLVSNHCYFVTVLPAIISRMERTHSKRQHKGSMPSLREGPHTTALCQSWGEPSRRRASAPLTEVPAGLRWCPACPPALFSELPVPHSSPFSAFLPCCVKPSQIQSLPEVQRFGLAALARLSVRCSYGVSRRHPCENIQAWGALSRCLGGLLAR